MKHPQDDSDAPWQMQSTRSYSPYISWAHELHREPVQLNRLHRLEEGDLEM